MIHLGSNNRGWSDFLSDGLAPRTGTAQSQVGDVLIFRASDHTVGLDGVWRAARPAQAGLGLAGTREISAESAFADCFLSNPCYDTLRSNHCLSAWQDKWGTRSPVKIFKQLVSFVLGVAVGACLHSVLTLRPLSPKLLSSFSPSARANDRLNDLRPPWVQRTLPDHVLGQMLLLPPTHVDRKPPEVALQQVRIKPEAEPVTLAASVPKPTEPAATKPFKSTAAKAIEMAAAAPVEAAVARAFGPAAIEPFGPANAEFFDPAAAKSIVQAALTLPEATVKPMQGLAPAELLRAAPVPGHEVAVAQASPAPPPVFQTIGYVEKAGGEVEAIILQENQIQVVHLGDVIAGRYRVTRVSPDAVDASDEIQAQSAMIESSVKKSEELTASVAAPPSNPPAFTAPTRAEVLPGPRSVEPLRNIQNAPPATPPPAVAKFQPATGIDPIQDVQGPPDQSADSTSLGFVQKANGKVESVVADGNSVRLIPEGPAVAAAGLIRIASYQIPVPALVAAEGPASVGTGGNAAAEPAAVVQRETGPVMSLVSQAPGVWKGASAKSLFSFKPMGFVQQGGGEVEAIVSEDDEVYVVRPGDRFADHYRAVSVSPDAVEAVEEPMRPVVPFRNLDAPAIPDLLSATAQPEPSRVSNLACSGCKISGLTGGSAKLWNRSVNESPAGHTLESASLLKSRQATHQPAHGPVGISNRAARQARVSTEPSTFIFQALGYVEAAGGDLQAIVADGSQVYLVRQGDTFAGQYLATSVDPVLVLAVKAPQSAATTLTAQTESGSKFASNKLGVQFPLFAWAGAQGSHDVGVSSGAFLTDLGISLLSSR
jgi:hypothetical protein